jgi:SAM-dependent methyltransferase
MHAQIRAFVKSAVEAFKLGGPVYEFGFCPGEPSGVVPLRDCFPDAGYVGCDLCDEAEVDQLRHFSHLPFPDGTARTVVCVNMLSHVIDPRQTLREMIRILMPGGVLLIAAVLDARCWDGSQPASLLQPARIRQHLAGLDITLVGWQGDPEAPHTMYTVGFRPPTPQPLLEGIPGFLRTFPARLGRLDAPAGTSPRLVDVLAHWWNHRVRQRSDYYKVEFVIDLPGQCRLSETATSDHSSGNTGSRLDLSDEG